MSINGKKFLSDKRDADLARGIQRNDGDNYVKCKIVVDGDTIKGEMRLKGHMTDHLKGYKWSFRVKTKDKEEEVFGMYRFSLQQPGTRNYAYEWIYHQLLKQEGIIHLKYDFIKVKLNDKDLGIYAIEEHFGQHILRDNNRPPGAILRWNPELYWEGRIDGMQKTYLDEDYSAYESSFAEPYDRGVVKKDSAILRTYQHASRMLEGFRRGEMKVSDVFDIEKLARFHAIIDLVGGQHSLDWSDIKFYYNSDTKLIEPVGYESFSIRRTEKIAGQRIPETYAKIGMDYHDKIFSDPVFFSSYMRNLERICDETYVNDFLASIKDELDDKWGVLAHEFAYIKVSYQGYYDNINLIRHNLNLPKPLHAFLEEKNDTTVRISVSPVSDFPLEILSVLIDDKNNYPLDEPFLLGPKPRNSFAHYHDIVFSHKDKKIKDLKLKVRILGSDNIFTVQVAEYPSYKELKISNDSLSANNLPKSDQFSWSNDSTCFFRSKSNIVDSKILIPEGVRLSILAGQEIIFKNNGQLVIDGDLSCYGHSDNVIRLVGENIAAAALKINNNGSIIANNVVFEGVATDFIVMQNAEGIFENCAFVDLPNRFIAAELSTINFFNCASGRVDNFAIMDRCLVRIEDFTAEKGNLFIADNGSNISIARSSIFNYNQAFILNHLSNVHCHSSVFGDNDLIAELNNSSNFTSIAGNIESGKLGFMIDLESDLSFESELVLYSSPIDNLLEFKKTKG